MQLEYKTGTNIKNEPFENHSIDRLKIKVINHMDEEYIERKHYDALNARYDIAQELILSLRISEDQLAQELGKKAFDGNSYIRM